jgi:hypothetical protein
LAGTTSGRYTAPLPNEYRHSPWWIPALILFFALGGILVIVLNYISLLPAAPSNWYLIAGLGGVVLGMAVATQYR